MATSAKGFGIALAIYAGVALVAFILFSYWRRMKFTRKFYAPKCYNQEEGKKKPERLGTSFIGWIGQVISISEDEIIRCNGVDAAVYIKILRMGFELFVFVSFICLAVILPINLTSSEVNDLIDAQENPTPPSQYTWWIPPPPPPTPPDGEPGPEPETTITPPEMYNSSIPDAPPGIIWWKYNDDVPPLPDLATFNVTGVDGWRYDDESVTYSYYFTDLDKTTMANVSPGDDRLWAHAVIMWVITFFCFWHLWRYNKIMLGLRMRYLLCKTTGAEARTVLCTDIPSVPYGTIPNRLDGTLLKLVPNSIKEQAMKQVSTVSRKATGSLEKLASTVVPVPGINTAGVNTDPDFDLANDPTESLAVPDRWVEAQDKVASTGSTHGMVEDTFRAVYAEDFAHAHICYDTTKLDKLVAEYDKLKGTADDLIDDSVAKKRRGAALKEKKVTVLGVKLGEWGKEKYGVKPVKVPALDYYRDRMNYLREEITKAQEEAKGKVFPSAFVTFNRRTDQVVASNALMSEDLTTWKCRAAPRPEEVIWKNLGMRSWERAARTFTMWVAYFLLICFFMIPVAAVQAIISTSSLVGFIQDIPIVSTFIVGIIPSLALIIFLAFLPAILRAMNIFQGDLSTSEVDMGVVSKFFMFQVVTVFFGSFIAGTFANQIEQLVDDPASIVDVLGTAAPQTAIFFLTYLLLEGLLVTPLAILRIVPLVIFWVKSKMASTQRARDRLWQDQMFVFGTVLPDDMIAVLLGLTFCIICPLIAPAAMIYFATGYLVKKHDLVYVFKQPYESGGLAWRRCFNQIICGLIIAQIVMIGLLGIKEMIAPPLVVLPLPFFTLIFLNTVHKTFWWPMEVTSLMAAAELDRLSPETASATDKEVAETYVSPSFNIDDTEHARVVDGCTKLQAVLQGGTDDAFFDSFKTVDEEGASLSGAGTTAGTVGSVGAAEAFKAEEAMDDAQEMMTPMATPRGEEQV